MRNINNFLFLIISFSLVACHNEPKKKVEIEGKKVVGIDISHNQGKINWGELSSQKNYNIKFVIIRSTMGDDRLDKKFKRNFKKAKEAGYLVGAYHYYDPNENSTRQARNFLRHSHIKDLDIIPVLDIEKISRVQSKKRLLTGIRNWLRVVEKETGVKPIIYTGLSFYKDNLARDFSGYKYWIAAYSDKRSSDPVLRNSHIHQFTEKGRIKGIPERYTVDINVVDRDIFEEILWGK